MKIIFFLFVFLNSFLFSSENMIIDTNLSKALSNEILLMKNSKVFLNYSLSVVKIKKIYKLLKNKKNYQEVLAKNPLPPSKIIFEKLEINKYNLLEKWEKEVFKTQPKDMSINEIREVTKILIKVRQELKPILDEIYKKTKILIIDSSEENIKEYKSYIERMKNKKIIRDSKVKTIVIFLLKTISTSPEIYIKTYQEHKRLDKLFSQSIQMVPQSSKQTP